MMNLLTQISPNATFLSSVLFFLSIIKPSYADNYALTSPEHKSLMVGMGCFWCGEEAFERYGPGVVEAVSGYAGGDNENPTYGNHPGHNEVVLVEYDPQKTSYEVLLGYAWKNLDPFNAGGQFCDRGTSYLPQVFYGTLEEKLVAEDVLAEIVADYPQWDQNDLVVPILPRPAFWIAEEYHQDYYIKNPGNYNYYKNACGRKNRLIEVWGEDEYKCYHDKELLCFAKNTTLVTNNTSGEEVVAYTVTNTYGEEVAVETNIKNIEQGKAALLPYKSIATISVAGAVLVFGIAGYCMYRRIAEQNRKKELMEKENNESKLPA